MGGASQADTKTTTQQLTPEQQQLVSAATPGYLQFATSNPTLPGREAISPFDPLQTAGQEQVLGAVPEAGKVVGGAAGANQWLTSGAQLNPESNPYLAKNIAGATAPIFRNLNTTTLPQLSADSSTNRAGTIGANVGGSREGIAEGLATQGAYDAAGNTAAAIANPAYQSGLSSLLQAIGQAPGTAAAQTIPGTITSTVGDVRQGQAQQMLSADTAAQQFQQWLPLLKAQLLTQGAGALPGGSTTSVGTSNKDPGLFQQIVGGASAAGGAAGGLAQLLPFLIAA